MERIFVLENDSFRAEISNMGAELRSLYAKRANREEIWTRDPSVWRKSAPWLFPVIGKLKNESFLYRGKTYAPGMHGFASGSVFSPVEATGDSLHLMLTDSETTREIYPWRFELHITYALTDKGLSIRIRILNVDTDEMFFSFGAHPGFLCTDGDRLVFEKAECLTVHRLERGTHLLLPAARDTHPTSEFVLSKELFENDAMILENPSSRSIRIERQDGSTLTYTFPQVPWLGLWTKPVSPMRYICIEPWFGVDDPVDADGMIEHKRGICRLEAGGQFDCLYLITVA